MNNIDENNFPLGDKYYYEELIFGILLNISENTDKGYRYIFKSSLMDIKTFNDCSSEVLICNSINLFRSIIIVLEIGDPEDGNFFKFSLPTHLSNLLKNLSYPQRTILSIIPCLNVIRVILKICSDTGQFSIIEDFNRNNGEEIVSGFITHEH
mmetsp:Transcript_27175/g.24055  ORF Transcript_27175/g.24055 Transcript_27175/m.24055 type:complete len:153 (+) Transcript_27175:1077-1535(+)